ncbi:MAG: S24/S26 family peptidase [Oscillospiraceae bacterium]|nr:S24/S26 family peptidase [Oscillospiraceae bacterium]
MSETLNIRQALAKYKKIIQPIRGISMLPMLNEGKDAVELVAVSGRLEKYDLVLFQRKNGQLVLHRIIAVKKSYYLICGDNSTAVEKVPEESIIAVASGFYKDGKYVSCQDEDYLTYVRDRWEDFSSRKLIKKDSGNAGRDTYEADADRTRYAVRKQGRIRYLGSRVFIPYHQMCMEYPCLWKLPFLLPVFWAVRLVSALFVSNKRRKLKTELTALAPSKKNKNG